MAAGDVLLFYGDTVVSDGSDIHSIQLLTVVGTLPVVFPLFVDLACWW